MTPPRAEAGRWSRPGTAAVGRARRLTPSLATVAALAVALATAVSCAGCSSSPPSESLPEPVSSGSQPSGQAAAPATAGDPDRPAGDSCAAQAKGMPFPAAFPPTVPLPPGFMITGSETRSGARQVISGVRPGGLRDTLEFMQRAYPAAGFTLSGGEVEESDAESDFAGNGLRGRWAIRELPQCNGDTTVEVVVAPT